MSKSEPNTELEILAREINSMICDWNAPSQLAVDMDATCKRIAYYVAQKVIGARKDMADSLIDEERKLYEIYADNSDICVGIKIMADKVRESYDG